MYRYSFTVTHRRPPLPTVIESYRYLRYINFKTLNICQKHTIYRSITRVTQVTVKYGNGH
jgi:hypothetical protein